MASSHTMRIVLLGKTGCGKSSLANTILGETLFKAEDSFSSVTRRCQTETKEINGRSVTLIDTPDFFCSDSEEEMKCKINNVIIECAPGPHAILLLFKLKRFTEQEQAVADKVCETFSEEALKYTCLVFTHGDDLPDGKKIEDFVKNNKRLVDLMRRCGGQCHVFDNKYWNNREENNYRSNKFQVRKLFDSINDMMRRNNERCFTNDMLQEVEKMIKSEEEKIRESSPHMTEEAVKRMARDKVVKTLSEKTRNIPINVWFESLFAHVLSFFAREGAGSGADRCTIL